MRHALPWPRTSAPSMPRAAVEAIIQAPFGPLRIITTHLEYYSSGHRAAQIERLRELHDETNRETISDETEGPFAPLPHPDSAIVCGDFNLPPDDPLRGRFLEAFIAGTPKLVDAWQALHPAAPHPHTFRHYPRPKRPVWELRNGTIPCTTVRPGRRLRVRSGPPRHHWRLHSSFRPPMFAAAWNFFVKFTRIDEGNRHLWRFWSCRRRRHRIHYCRCYQYH